MPRVVLFAVLLTSLPVAMPAQGTGLLARGPEAYTLTLDAVAPPGNSLSAPLTLELGGEPVTTSTVLPAERAQLVLVLDALNSSPEQFARSVEAVSAFLGSDKGHLSQPTTVLVVSGGAPHTPEPGEVNAGQHRALSLQRIPASTDGLAVRASLRRLAAQAAHSPETIADRVGLSLDALAALSNAEAAEPGAKVVLWLGPGWPLLPASAREDKAARQHVFDSVVTLSGMLLHARILLSMLDPSGVTAGSSGFNEGFLLATRPAAIRSAGRAPALPESASGELYLQYVQSPRSAAQARENDLALQVLAVQSGGEVVRQTNSLAASVARAAADAGRIRSFRFQPPAVSGVLQFLPVRVTETGRSVALRSRQGIYAR